MAAVYLRVAASLLPGSEVIHFVDNQSALYGMAKGSSSQSWSMDVWSQPDAAQPGRSYHSRSDPLTHSTIISPSLLLSPRPSDRADSAWFNALKPCSTPGKLSRVMRGNVNGASAANTWCISSPEIAKSAVVGWTVRPTLKQVAEATWRTRASARAKSWVRRK